MYTSLSDNWKEIMNTIGESQYVDVHKFYSRTEGWLYITTPTMQRIKITPETAPHKVRILCNDVVMAQKDKRNGSRNIDWVD